jgi:hypothetical protein
MFFENNYPPQQRLSKRTLLNFETQCTFKTNIIKKTNSPRVSDWSVASTGSATIFDRLSHRFRIAQPPFSTDSATIFELLSHQFLLSKPVVEGTLK